MRPTKAIVTLAIGKRHLKRWKSLCESNWHEYAARHGYDVICVDTPLDDSPRARRRSPAWQKCLILSQDFAKKYERIVWIDSDILINARAAPCIVKDVPIDKVGAGKGWSWPSPELFDRMMERQYELWGGAAFFGFSPTVEHLYTSWGLPDGVMEVAQTGVMVLSPQHHRQTLEMVYNEYEERGAMKWHYEARPLSYELLRTQSVHWVDHRFSSLWPVEKILYYPFLYDKTRWKNRIVAFVHGKYFNATRRMRQRRYAKLCATTAFLNNYFLHFAGSADEMDLVNVKAASCFNVHAWL
jgi:hypothetical protein